MSDFTQAAGTLANARKLAGASSARQVRQVEVGNTINYDLFPFLTLYGGKAVLNDGKLVNVKERIKSKSAWTMTPELYDWEVAATEFRLTADVAATAGSNSVLLMDDTSGLQVDDTLNLVNQGLQFKIASIDSQTQVTALCYFNSAGGTVTATGHASIKYLEKIGNANPDGPSAANGTNREPINRTNNLQFMMAWMAQGPLQRNLKLYAGGETPDSDYKEEINRKFVDLNRMREGMAIAGQKATSGSGSTLRYYSGGLEYLAGSVYNNNTVDGTLQYDDFARGLMPGIRQGGAGMDVYALAGIDVINVFTSFQQKQTRITDTSKEVYRQKIMDLDVPGGQLHLIPSEFMNKQARQGQMIAFQSDLLSRYFLQNMDLSLDEDMKVLGTDWVDRAAIYVVEGLLASNPKAVTLVTNVKK
jgi:hypothetical protein